MIFCLVAPFHALHTARVIVIYATSESSTSVPNFFHVGSAS